MAGATFTLGKYQNKQNLDAAREPWVMGLLKGVITATVACSVRLGQSGMAELVPLDGRYRMAKLVLFEGKGQAGRSMLI